MIIEIGKVSAMTKGLNNEPYLEIPGGDCFQENSRTDDEVVNFGDC